ncbi:MAG TPA: transglycosylase SLT domain-containing protein [Flavobacteriales bacterium]|nr:transglycosylase SLT domain-containing protein [Flavobacteriales bacterium]
MKLTRVPRSGMAMLVAMLCPGLLRAQDTTDRYDEVLERIDALSALPWLKNDPFTTDVRALNKHGFAPTDTPKWAPEVLRQRLADLDARTPFSLVWNAPVESYIAMYTVRKREQAARMLGLAQLYFPVFEEALDRYNLPQELKYLAVVESALYPGARSRAAAVGLWQFMIGTGKLYGLRSDSYVDERCDVYKSTDAACRYLKDLYRIFGSWELALAAYNCGPGNVNKAMRRSGGKDYWGVYDRLPRETRGYVPAFIAVNYLFHHAADHNLYPIMPNYCAYEVDTVQVNYPVDLAKMAALLGGNPQELLDLNPVYKRGHVPNTGETATLYLPRTLVAAFIDREDTIRNSWTPEVLSTAPVAQVAAPDQHNTASSQRTHIVRRGESLGSITQKHDVTVKQLRTWNGLHSDRIHPGKRLIVRMATAPSRTASVPDTPVEQGADAATEIILHTVQPGDTLWGIAKRYPGATVDGIRRINDVSDVEELKVGKKIKVAVQKG